jgi:hypothetical protein
MQHQSNLVPIQGYHRGEHDKGSATRDATPSADANTASCRRGFMDGRYNISPIGALLRSCREDTVDTWL